MFMTSLWLSWRLAGRRYTENGMSGSRMRALRRVLWNSGVGLLATALVTLAGRALGVNALVISSLYLLSVTVISLTGDFAAAAIASLAAVGCLDYFFTQPLYSFRVENPADVTALFTSLATALVITRLATKARAEARNASLQRQRVERLYQLAQQLLAFDPGTSEFLEP